MDKLIYDEDELPQQNAAPKKAFNLSDALNNAKMFGRMKED